MDNFEVIKGRLLHSTAKGLTLVEVSVLLQAGIKHLFAYVCRCTRNRYACQTYNTCTLSERVRAQHKVRTLHVACYHLKNTKFTKCVQFRRIRAFFFQLGVCLKHLAGQHESGTIKANTYCNLCLPQKCIKSGGVKVGQHSRVLFP